MKLYWWHYCFGLGLVLLTVSLAGYGVVRLDRYLDERDAACYTLFDGNVIGTFCPIAEFRERPPVAP